MQSAYYPNFDWLRLGLAAEVLVGHTIAHYSGIDWRAPILAVPAFLCLSGFLVLKSFEETESYSEFLKKRALRILPALCVSFALCLLLFDVGTARDAFLNWVSGGLYIRSMEANAPLWSLAWEELAYAALAVLWAMGAYKRRVWIFFLLVISVGVSLAASDLSGQTRMILLLPPAFFTGNLVYLYRDILSSVPKWLPWGAAICTVFAFQLYIISGVVAVVIQGFCLAWLGFAGARVIPFRFPDISYGIYIYHMILLAWMAKHSSVSGTLEALAWIAITLLPLCLASWYLVEKPALRFKRRRSPELAPS